MNRVIDVKSINPYNNCILGNIIFLQYLSISIGLVDQMWPCFYRLRCEVFQNLFLSPMNTGFVRPAVAAVLTVYGIETETSEVNPPAKSYKLQQYLPFTVLKLKIAIAFIFLSYCCNSTYRLRYWNRSWRKRWITWA